MPLVVKSLEDFKNAAEGSEKFMLQERELTVEGKTKVDFVVSTSQFAYQAVVSTDELNALKAWLQEKGTVVMIDGWRGIDELY